MTARIANIGGSSGLKVLVHAPPWAHPLGRRLWFRNYSGAPHAREQSSITKKIWLWRSVRPPERTSTTCKVMLCYKRITHEVHVVAKQRNLRNILLLFNVTNLRSVKNTALSQLADRRITEAIPWFNHQVTMLSYMQKDSTIPSIFGPPMLGACCVR